MLEKVVSILFPIFAIVIAGYFVGRQFKPDMRDINRINVDLMIPCLVFTTLSTMPLGKAQSSLFFAACIAVLLPGLLMVPISKLLNLPFKTWGPPQMFRNSGNLAIPLFGYAFGAAAEAPAILLFIVSVLLHVTVGSLLMSNQHYQFKSAIKMPLLWASVVAIVFNFSSWTLWKPLYEGMALIGQAAVPIMLISLGVQLTGIRWSGIRVGLVSTGLSLLTGGITFAAIYLLIPLPSEHLRMLLLFSMLPPAVMNFLFAERFKVGAEQVASMVLFGNLLTTITLPVLLLVAFSYL